MQTNLVKNFLSTDTSCAVSRYNLFTIVEGTDVELNDAGQWTYIIYAQTSSSNTDPSLADEIVETGRVLVVDPTASSDVDYTALDNNVDIQYTPE